MRELNRKCPNCGSDVEDDAVICVRCGVNMRTGFKADQHSVIADEMEITFRDRLVGWIWEYCPGLFRPVALIAAIVMTAIGWAGIGLALALLFSFPGLFAPFFIGAAGFLFYAQGIAFFMVGEVWLLHDALVEFRGHQWTVFFALLSLPMVTALVYYKVAVEDKKASLPVPFCKPALVRRIEENATDSAERMGIRRRRRPVSCIVAGKPRLESACTNPFTPVSWGAVRHRNGPGSRGVRSTLPIP